MLSDDRLGLRPTEVAQLQPFQPKQRRVGRVTVGELESVRTMLKLALVNSVTSPPRLSLAPT